MPLSLNYRMSDDYKPRFGRAYAPIKPAAVPDPKRSPVIASISKGRHRPCKLATKLDRLRNALTVIADLILRDAT